MTACAFGYWRVSVLSLLAAATASAAVQWSTGRNVMPAVVGHRGIPAIFPENTMISFRAALEAGADGIESDLHLTADKVLVLLHDDTLNRTTNCTGYVGDYTLAQLSSCNANYNMQQYGFVPIPTFEEAVVLVAAYQAFFVLDLKENALLGSYIRPVVDRHNAASLVIMSCWTFDQVADAVRYMNASSRQFLNTTAWGLTGQSGSMLGPGSPSTGLTVNASLPVWEDYLTRGIRAFSMMAPVTPVFVEQAHARTMPVFVWTIDDPASMNAMIDAGVDGILTNNVHTLLGVVSNRADIALHGALSGADAGYSAGTLGAAVGVTAVVCLLTGAAVVGMYMRRYVRVVAKAQEYNGLHDYS